MPGINLPSAVGLSSSDVVVALRAFFTLGVVLPVMALLMALVIVPRVVSLFRHFVLEDRSVFGDTFFDASGRPTLLPQRAEAVVGPNLDDSWVSVPSDLPGWNMEYEPATGTGVSWRPSTRAEIAALDPGLPEIYQGHDPDEFDAIQAQSYEEFRARCDELDRQQAAMLGASLGPFPMSGLEEQTEAGLLADADREMIERAGLDEFEWGEDDVGIPPEIAAMNDAELEREVGQQAEYDAMMDAARTAETEDPLDVPDDPAWGAGLESPNLDLSVWDEYALAFPDLVGGFYREENGLGDPEGGIWSPLLGIWWQGEPEDLEELEADVALTLRNGGEWDREGFYSEYERSLSESND